MITLYLLIVSILSFLGMYLLYLPYKLGVKWLDKLDGLGLFMVVIVWVSLQGALLSCALYSLFGALISPLIYLIFSL